MTFSGWETTYSHKLDLMCHSELRLLGEWGSWISRIEVVLAGMDYEDAIGCEFEDLIGLAGLTDEVKAAKDKLIKDAVVNKRIEKLNADF